MKLVTLWTLLLYSCSTVAQLHLPFSRQLNPIDVNSASRRAVGVSLFEAESTYVVNATVGTPPQSLDLILAVSSGRTWVPNVEYCRDLNRTALSLGGCLHGAYNSSTSSTYATYASSLQSSFSARYIDGTYAYGAEITESLSLGGAGITNLTMGLVRSTNMWMGVLGLGYRSTEDEPNVPELMVKQGLINSTGYSIWLDDKNAESGSLLLGAVDTARYEPPLRRIQASRSAAGYDTFGVKIGSINGSSSADGPLTPLSNGIALPFVSISPPDTVSNLPLNLAERIWSLAGATYNESYSKALIPCDVGTNSAARIAVELGGTGGPILDIPVRDMIVPRSVWVQSTWSWNTDSATVWCMFGVQSVNNTESRTRTTWSLGSTMLKRSYIAFDLINEEVAVAPVKSNVDGTSAIAPFSSYGAVIPNSLKAGSRVCWAYEPCSTATSNETGGGFPVAAIIGIVVAVCALSITGLAIWLLWRRRDIIRRNAASQSHGNGNTRHAPMETQNEKHASMSSNQQQNSYDRPAEYVLAAPQEVIRPTRPTEPQLKPPKKAMYK
jgi:hypothetical protein